MSRLPENCLTKNFLTKTRLLTAVVAVASVWAAACGGGGMTITPPPPMGKYSLASLSGTYAFTTSGETIVNTSTGPVEAPLARTGSFTANGSGSIQGGVYDLVVAGSGSTTQTVPDLISGGSYSVNADGRGTLTLNVTSSGGPATISYGIVLTSTSSGLMIDETDSTNQASTGSGNFILQNSSAFAAGVSGSYVFDFSGFDGANNPESLVGQFSASGGTITSGFEDANDGTTLTNGSIAGGGNFALDAANTAAGRGTATIEGQTYAFYVVDSTRVRFISIDFTGAAGAMLTGDAVVQPTVPAAPSGSFAFLVAGSSANGGLIRVARFDVSGTTVSKLLMDVNNAGPENEFGPSQLTNASLSYDATIGRGLVSFQSSSLNIYSFVFYLSSATSGVIQEVSPNDTTPAFSVDDGTIAAQSASPFTSSNITGPYAMNWSGLVSSSIVQDEEDLLAQQTITSLNLSGTYDLFQFTAFSQGTNPLSTGLGSTGSITFNGAGTGGDGKNTTMTVNLSNASPIQMVVYFVNPQLAFFVSGNNNTQRIVAGILKAQQ